MPAVVEFGFNAAPVFTGVDSMERRIKGMDGVVRQAMGGLKRAMENPWVSAGLNQQKYFDQLVATERQTRMIAAAHARLAAVKPPPGPAQVTPWITAGAPQFAAQQQAAKAAAELAAQRRAGDAASAAAYAAQMQRAAAAQQAGARAMQQQAAAAQQAARVTAGGSSRDMRRMNIGMAAMQAQDIAVQMQMGTRMSTIVAQQGSQLLSVFGPAGMILGGLAAIGGALYTVREKSREAFEALQKEAAGFDAAMRKALAGGVSGMAEAIAQMTSRARELRDSIPAGSGLLTRFFSSSTFDPASGQWTNQMDAENAEKRRLAAEYEKGRVKLIDEILRMSGEETRLAVMRAEGRTREADQLERQLALITARQKIDEMDIPSAEKATLKRDLDTRAGAENRAANAVEMQQAFDKTEQIIAAQKRLDERKKAAALAEMGDAKAIATLRVDLARLADEEAAIRADFAPDGMRLIEIENERLDIQRQILDAQKRVNAEQARAIQQKQDRFRFNDEIKAIEQERAAKQQAMDGFQMELALIEAKIQGRDKNVRAIEREMEITRRARQIERDTGVDATKARAMATQMTDTQRRLQEGDGVRKIKGYSFHLDPAAGLSGRSGPLSAREGPLARGGPLTAGGGIDGYKAMQGSPSQWDRLQQGKSAWQKLQGGKSQWTELQDRHAANAGRDAPSVSADALVEKILKLLPQNIAAALLTP